MNIFKSHSIYDRRKRSGILLFVALIVICTVAVILVKPKSGISISPEEDLKVMAFQQEIDSLKAIEIENRKPKIYKFNPTLLTDYNGYKLGMSIEEIDRVVRFRESGKWFDSTSQFQKVSGVSDSLLAVISPYFKWPKWMSEKKSAPVKKYTTQRTWKTTEEKAKLNSITLEKLLDLDGVDEEAATKIMRHLNKTGGYQIDQQLYDVYGVSTKIKRAVLDEYTVKEKPSITLMNVNTATASDLSTVPMVNFDLAKEIVDFRILREGITSLEELKDLEGMTPYKFERIRLYLRID